MKKENSLKKAKDFQKVIDTRQSVGCKSFVIYYLKNEFDYARIGISSGKRLGNAVIRNRTKRQVRSIIDLTFDKNKNPTNPKPSLSDFFIYILLISFYLIYLIDI